MSEGAVFVTQLLEEKEVLYSFLDCLPFRQRRLLILRFGLESEGRHTLGELAKIFGVSKERIRQIEAQAFKNVQKLTEVCYG